MLGVVVGVERADVAPVAAVLLGAARDDVAVEVVDLRLAALDETGDDVAAHVVAAGLALRVLDQGVDRAAGAVKT